MDGLHAQNQVHGFTGKWEGSGNEILGVRGYVLEPLNFPELAFHPGGAGKSPLSGASGTGITTTL